MRARYRLTVVGPDYPYPYKVLPDGRRLAFVHRLAAERMLGRYLVEGEVVHHVDGDPSNNAPENLRVYSSQAEHMREAHRRRDAESLTLPF